MPAHDLAARDPAFVAAALVTAACIVVLDSVVLFDTDLWTLLAGGKTIWALRQIPRVDLWTWPHYGQPMVLSSWAFRALLWPVWSAAGVPGLFALRWACALFLFATLWAAARVMGARALPSLVMMAWGAAMFSAARARGRSCRRLALLALEILVLERRRAGGAAAGRVGVVARARRVGVAQRPRDLLGRTRARSPRARRDRAGAARAPRATAGAPLHDA
jgi:hypothetical protein